MSPEAVKPPDPSPVDPLKHPRPSLDSNGVSTIERLEESAARLGLSSGFLPDDHRPTTSRHTSAPSRSSSSRSSLKPAPLYTDSKGIDPHGFPASVNSSSAAIAGPLSSTHSSQPFSWSQASGLPNHSDSRSTNSKPLTEPEQEGRPLESMLSRSSTSYARSSISHRTPFPRLETTGNRNRDGEPESNITKQDPRECDQSSTKAAPTRSSSNASKASTLQGARSLFRDFDGTHYLNLAGDIAEEDEEQDEASSLLRIDDDNDLETPDDLSQEDQAEHGRTSFNFDDENAIEHSETGSVLEQQHDETSYIYQRSQSWAVPPPDEQMVYYPAPVPMNLNLPKRLSRQSPATIQAQRRSQILDAMDTETRRSTRWLPNDSSLAEQDEPTAHEIKRKTLNLQKLPPQLRASMFFDHQPVPHHLEIQQGSAVLTLERMLDASAQTPIGVAATLPSPRARKSRSTLMSNETLGLRQSRSSVIPGTALSNDYLSTPKSLRFDRSSSSLAIQTDALGETKAREYDGYTAEDAFVQSSKDFSGSVEDDYVHVGDTVGADENLLAQEESEDNSEEENHLHELASAQPNTLLAELALRKEQLRSRNRTAAKSFPDGMQSTLLELDEVAQIEKRRRMKKPTQLAWESMEAANGVKAQQADDDIPLAILYGNKSGLVGRAGERPIGLMEKRALDDNEPLSQRRNRLLGIQEFTSHHTRQQSRGSVPIVGVAPQEQSEVETEETLAQRTRRLRSSRLLDEAIGLESGKHVRAVSDDFASEMMSQLGVDSSQGISKDAKTPQTEETLGQRKRRLQAERQATGSSANDVNDGQHAHPSLRSTQSLANILAAAPVGVNKFSNTPIPRVGSIGLLGASEVELAARRQHITDRNLRSTTTMSTGGPLVEIPFGDKRPLFRGEMSRERQLLDSYNDSFGGIASRPQSTSPGPQKSMARKNSAMNLSLHYDPGLHTPSSQMYQRQQYWQAAQGHGISSGTSMSVPMIQPGYAFAPNSQAQYWQQQMYPTMNPTLDVNTSLGPGMALAFAEADMSPEQRTNIDRWRQSVMP